MYGLSVFLFDTKIRQLNNSFTSPFERSQKDAFKIHVRQCVIGILKEQKQNKNYQHLGKRTKEESSTLNGLNSRLTFATVCERSVCDMANRR